MQIITGDNVFAYLNNSRIIFSEYIKFNNLFKFSFNNGIFDSPATASIIYFLPTPFGPYKRN